MKLPLDITKIQSFYTYLKSGTWITFPNIVFLLITAFSLIMILSGFVSAMNNSYIGDGVLRFLLLATGILFIIQTVKIRFKHHYTIKLLLPTICFIIILFLFAYFLPLFPPKYDLRPYEITASLLKFLVISIFLILTGLLSLSFNIRSFFGFTSKGKQYSAYIVLIFSILLILYPLIIFIGNITVNGIGGINWEFLTEDVRSHGQQGGIVKALIGTICLIIGVTVISLPLGIGAAVYLTEYAKGGIIVRIIRITVDILQGIPSIVFGLFALAVLVPLFGISLINGILVLSFLTLPIIIRASEEAILAVPGSIREGSYALGASKWQTIKRVVLPPALPGIITGGVLGLGRAAGETAPIMFVACVFLGAPHIPNLFAPIQALPYHLLTLIYYLGAYEVEQNAWATAFLLIAIVLLINAGSILIREKYRVEF